MNVTTAAPAPAKGVDRSAFRADIEGMRAIAVIAVMAWHAGLPWVRGGFVGVDIFFVISGFLMTSVLLRDMQAHGRIRIGRFYMRRIRRLLPAAATALAGTAVLTWLMLPTLRWRDIAGDIAAAALYFVNWRFASDSVDYLAQGEAPSPVQHFWSLSVEEQFYLVLPVAFALICLMVAGEQLRRGLLWFVIGAVVVTSFAWSVYYTDTQPGQAYFVTTTRMWQLALGGLVAMAGPLLSALTERVAAVIGWLGLAAVLAGIIYIDASDPFPGTIAALPTLGAAAILAGGASSPRMGPVMVLRPRFMQRVGALSYSLYLWHWPFLVAAAAWLGDEEGDVRLRVSLIAVALCIVPAWLSFHFVEERFRRRPARRREGPAAGALLAACTCVSLTAAGCLALAVSQESSAAEAAYAQANELISDTVDAADDDIGGPTAADSDDAPGDSAASPGDSGGSVGNEDEYPEPDGSRGSSPDASWGSYGSAPQTGSTSPRAADTAPLSGDDAPLGALALGANPQDNPAGRVPTDVSTIVPDPLLARDDLAAVYDEGCQRYVSVPRVCHFGDQDGDYRAVLVGDSHAAHWFPAVEKVAEDRGWQLDSITRPACPLITMRLIHGGASEQESCEKWAHAALDTLLKDPPDLVVMTAQAHYRTVDDEGATLSYKKSKEPLAAGYRSVLSQLVAAGSRVLVIADTPRPEFDVVDCVARNLDNLSECSFDRDKSLETDPLALAQETADLPGTAVVDMTDAICPQATCSPVIGNVLIYRDGHHITQTYALSMAPLLASAFDEVPFIPGG